MQFLDMINPLLKYSKLYKVQPDYFSKAPKWLLWIGLMLFILGNISLNLFVGSEVQHYDQIHALVDEIIPRNLVVVMIVFLLPFIEELRVKDMLFCNL